MRRVLLLWRRLGGLAVTALLLAIIVLAKRLRTTPERVYERRPPAAVLDHVPFRFREEAARLGLVYQHRLYFPNPRAGSYLPLMALPPAIAVADFDGDGFMDIYVVQPEPGQPNRLFRNIGGERFEDVAAEVGLADVDKRYAGLDGRLGRLQRRRSARSPPVSLRLPLALLARRRSAVRPTSRSTRRLSTSTCSNPKAVNVADVNRDGWLDLSFSATTTQRPTSRRTCPTIMCSARPAPTCQGGGTDVLLGSPRGFSRRCSAGLARTRRRMGLSDIDDDGWPDLFASNDYTYDEMLRNDAGRRTSSTSPTRPSRASSTG